MELWIRSQDKESLLKIENISIDNENWVLGNLISDDNKCICDYWKLGHYKTNERALEVLDEIQDILKSQMVLTKLGDIVAETCDGTVYREPDEVEIKELNVVVYEMPIE